jgi:hypothetical protein
MTTAIVRVYETEQQARDAVGKLRAEGFPKDAVLLVTPASKGDAETVEPLSMAVKAGFVPQPHAKAYTGLLDQGRSLVATRAPFGQALPAERALDSCGPIDAGLEKPEGRPVAWEVGAPLSSALLLPVLSRRRAEAFSMSFGFPTLAADQTARFGNLARSDYALFGQPSLSRNPAPLSSIFRIKTVSGKTGPSWNSSFGMPLLSQDPAPLSARIGLETLRGKPRSAEPAPFSANLGMPPLTRGRSALSRLFGELASPHFALFGRNPLMDKAAPLSSLFGLGTSSGKSGASWTSSFGLPMLTSGQGPVLATIPMLSRNPAPLSSLFGLRVLSIYQ